MISSQDEFLHKLLSEIASNDKLHSKKVSANIDYLKLTYPNEFTELYSLIYQYFQNDNIDPVDVATSYLRMVKDMRKEGIYFLKNDSYRCKNQAEAYEKVYSQSDVMSYYMKALIMSQVLWTHHFKMFIYFRDQLAKVKNTNGELRILDVGPGHGFFSFIVRQLFPELSKIDLVDISNESIAMTKKIIGEYDKVHYHIADIYDYNSKDKYDIIILGEVLEHLDTPKTILVKLTDLLAKEGVIWFTTPTNSPALDHVYLFRTKEDVYNLVSDANMEVVHSNYYFAEDVSEEVALKNRVTNLVGVFAKNK